MKILKGRKRAGGIRFGEMERDALLAHGTSFLLQDRLMNCSDYSTAWVCRTCGSLISLGYEDVSLAEVVLGRSGNYNATGPTGEYCRICRAEAEDADAKARRELGGEQSQLTPSRSNYDVRLAIPPQNVLGKAGRGGDMDVVAVPFVFRYLCAELAAMGIKVSLECS
jgi:DNA-directed RNA polymerase I subunit RPA2